MRKIKLIISILFSIILFITPANIKADNDNDFTAQLSVSDTIVTSGETITCTITVENTDTTYGADISISYNGQYIDSYYLNAGQTETTTHNITVYKTTDVNYTVYASHGPDISKTKNTNTVTVQVIEPATNTFAPTHTPYVETETITPTPTAVITELVTPEVTLHIEPDENLGWGKPIKFETNSLRIMDNVLKESPADWLGIGQENKGEYKNIYTMRKIIAGIAALIVLSFSLLIVAMVRMFKK